MANTYEELMLKSRELHAAGDIDGARRVAKIALGRKAQSPAQSPLAISPEQRAANIAANAGNQAEIDAAAMGGMKEAGYDTSAPQAPGKLMTALLGVNQGVTFGFGDEIAARIHSLSPNVTYDQALASNRGLLQSAKEANPGTALVSEIVGSVTSGLGAAKAAGAGLKSLAPRIMSALSGGGLAGGVARGAGIGAAEGGLYGAGSADGADMGEAIGKGALLGAGMGAAAPVAIAGVSKAGNAAIDAVGGVLPFGIGSAGRSNRAMQTALARSGMTVDQVDEAVKAATREGQPAFTIADALGNPGQRELSKIARQPGEGRKEIVDFLMNRQNGQARRLGPMLADALDAPDTALQRQTGMVGDLRAAAKKGYGEAAASAGAVDVNPSIDMLTTTINKMSGSGITPPRIVSEFEKLRGKMAGVTPKGEKTTLSDYESVVALWQEVKDDIKKAYNAGDGSLAEALKPIRDSLEGSLSAASDTFRATNAMYREGKSAISQIDAGKAATSGRVRAADTLDQYGKLTSDQQGAFKAGYADPLLAKVEGGAQGVNKARALMDDATTAELGAMAKDPAMLQRQIGRENTMFETAAQAMGGSRTADNLQDIAESNKFDTGMLVNLLSGRFGTAAAQLLPKLAGQTDATRAKIAKMLLSTDAKGVLTPIAKKTANSEATKRVIEEILRSGAIRAGQ